MYFECYEGDKLIHTSTSLGLPEEMEEYIKDFPERRIVKVDKEFFHTIKIYDSQEATWCQGCSYIGKITISDTQFQKIRTIPHLGCGISPTEGCYSLTFSKTHIPIVMNTWGKKSGQLQLSDFIEVKSKSKRGRKCKNG